MADGYTPTDLFAFASPMDAAREAYCVGRDEPTIDTGAEFDRFLARVRRDAARSALDGLVDTVRAESGIRLHVATRYRDANYPEVTP